MLVTEKKIKLNDFEHNQLFDKQEIIINKLNLNNGKT